MGGQSFFISETDREGRTAKDRYLQGVLEKASESWTAEGGIEKQWQSVHTAIVLTAAEVLGPQGITSLIGLPSHLEA